jgi:hypothetical protein
MGICESGDAENVEERAPKKTFDSWNTKHKAGTIKDAQATLTKHGAECVLFASGLNKNLNKAALLVVNTYTKKEYQLGVAPMNDAVNVADSLIPLGFKVYFTHNPKSAEFLKILKHFISMTKTELFIYYTGHGTRVTDKNGDEADGKDEAMVFDDAFVTDDKLLEVLKTKCEGSKVILVNDCCHSGSIWDLKIGKGLPENCLCLSAAMDSQTAKQTSVGGADQGIFTFYFFSYVDENKSITADEMEAQINTKISKYNQHFTKSSTSPGMFSKPIFE